MASSFALNIEGTPGKIQTFSTFTTGQRIPSPGISVAPAGIRASGMMASRRGPGGSSEIAATSSGWGSMTRSKAAAIPT